ncbi:proline-specific peptidase [Hymenopellis radicata]|nr:proline-specific peptidase [Hymenopellis radicata]
MSSPTTGTVPFVYQSKTYETFYTVYGDLKSGKTPVVALHGGPGLTHHYMLPNKALYEQAGILVLFYDQIGNGASSHVKDAPKEFWRPQLFMDELDNLLKKLNITSFDLVGHSWGGMLAGHYAAERTPSGLRRLVIANAPASTALLEESTNALLDKFPADFVKMLRDHEEAATTSDPEYQAGMGKFYYKHVCHMDPWPQDLLQSFEAVGQDPTVYNAMIGASEFNVVGTLVGWSVVDIVHNIRAPTLLLSAPLDEVQKEAALPWFRGIPKVKWVELQNSTHLGQFEEPEKYITVVRDFLEN